jgi:hypothetical protein
LTNKVPKEVDIMATTYRLKNILSASLLLTVAGCNAHTEKPLSSNVVDATNYAAQIHICRNSSFVAGLDKPDIVINDQIVGELSNGSRLTVGAMAGANFKIFLPSNFLLNRHRDETILTAEVQRGISHLIIETKINIGAGIASASAGSALGGAILGAAGATTSILLGEDKTEVSESNSLEKNRMALTDFNKNLDENSYHSGYWAVNIVDSSTFSQQCETG